jgi:hypothetical protein
MKILKRSDSARLDRRHLIALYDALSSASQHPALTAQSCRSRVASLFVGALERAPYMSPRNRELFGAVSAAVPV